MPPQLGTSSAANNHTIKDTASSNKRLEMLDTKTGGLQPLKKLKSGKHVSFALENQEFPKRTRDKDGKLSDSGFLIVEVTCYYRDHSSVSIPLYRIWEQTFAYDTWVNRIPSPKCFESTYLWGLNKYLHDIKDLPD